MHLKPGTLKAVSTFLMLSFIFSVTFTGSAFAGPRPDGRPEFYKRPPGSHEVHHRGHPYLYHKGHFYRHKSKGYYHVRPPFGAVVLDLPTAAAIAIIAGITYYVYEDTYYRRVKRGYEVVQAPVSNTGSHVLVNVDMLNVRTGPGLSHSIISVVQFGDRLEVCGNAPEWFYVKLPDGRFGWVMQKFVALSDTGAKG